MNKIALCNECRKIKEMNIYRNKCKPCYNEWFQLYRLEKKQGKVSCAMIVKCQFCEYQREQKLSLDILRVLAEPDLPEEDYLLWMLRLVKHSGLTSYNSVKIHMGRKHQDKTFKYIQPAYELNTNEAKIISSL